MSWHALVEIDAAVPGAGLGAILEAHPRLTAVSVHAPMEAPSGWRRALAGFGRTRAASVFVSVAADDRAEAERIARAAVEDALARLGIEAKLRVGAFRRG